MPGDIILLDQPNASAAPTAPSTGASVRAPKAKGSRTVTVTCDALLLYGECVMQEATLTGESLPVTKTALPRDLRLTAAETSSGSATSSIAAIGRHTLFAGTQLIQATNTSPQQPVTALVIRTGITCTTCIRALGMSGRRVRVLNKNLEEGA